VNFRRQQGGGNQRTAEGIRNEKTEGGGGGNRKKTGALQKLFPMGGGPGGLKKNLWGPTKKSVAKEKIFGGGGQIYRKVRGGKKGKKKKKKGIGQRKKKELTFYCGLQTLQGGNPQSPRGPRRTKGGRKGEGDG